MRVTVRTETSFDLCGPLPGPGTTVLEASAGTGKTYALTALVVRFVAEGTPLSSILAVTFTRMATGELRDRIRTRLVETEAALATGAGGAGSSGDDVARLLVTGTPDEVEARRLRLADAVAGFDAATIATTHGFCQLVIDGLGVVGAVGDGTTLLEDPSELVEEVLDDLYLRLALRHGPQEFGRRQARRVARQAVDGPDVVPWRRTMDDAAGRLGVLADMTRREVRRRLAESDRMTYDQLLTGLCETLDDDTRGPVAGARLRDRFGVVLVDEFQDTDPTQWRIVRAAFGDGGTTLVLVGDPKQAIYSFRGADVEAYLDAAALADRRLTLDVNRRSDGPLLDALEALLSPLRYGHAEIVHRRVRASDERDGPGLDRAPATAPLRVRVVPGGFKGITTTSTTRLHEKAALTTWVAGDVARDVAGLLHSAATVTSPGGPRPVRPADVAVLTRTNRQSVAVRDAMREEGIPAVIAGADNVFATDAARDWSALLAALSEPGLRSRAAAAALTPFVGWDAAVVATADETSWEDLHDRLRRWAGCFATLGVAALYLRVGAEGGLPARMLAVVGGERRLTDLGHVAQLLHSQSHETRPGAGTLGAWLGQRIAAVGEHADADERSLRLDSDAEAVQVLTVHAAKGLEWGVVYCPYLWDAARTPTLKEPVVFHDGATGGRMLDVGPWDLTGPDAAACRDNRASAQTEQWGEDLRLMYVALTRARHQVVVWWGRTHQCQDSPLGRVLHSRDRVTGEVSRSARVPGDADTQAALAEVAGRAAPGLVAIEDATAGRPDAPCAAPGHPGGAGPLEAATFTRDLDTRWRRSSYTSITAPAHASGRAAPIGSEPETPGLGDEPDLSAAADDGLPPRAGAGAGPGAMTDDPQRAVADVVCPLATVPGGADVGTVVHRCLEHVDFAAGDLAGAIRAALSSVPGSSTLGPHATVVGGLVAALTTPLGPLLGDMSLRDLRRGDRLDEMGFELPVAGGDRPNGEVTTAAVATVLARHVDPAGALADYPASLAEPLLATSLRGYLTGSLDLVMRTRGPDGEPRWYVADYKTNRLGERDRPLTAWDYRPAALDAEMCRRHYPLQAVLYLVALHRYLDWRMPGYDPAVHLGGAVYLFVRGMTGPSSPVVDGQPCGVWSWAPPTALVLELSDLFDRGRS